MKEKTRSFEGTPSSSVKNALFDSNTFTLLRYTVLSRFTSNFGAVEAERSYFCFYDLRLKTLRYML